MEFSGISASGSVEPPRSASQEPGSAAIDVNSSDGEATSSSSLSESSDDVRSKKRRRKEKKCMKKHKKLLKKIAKKSKKLSKKEKKLAKKESKEERRIFAAAMTASSLHPGATQAKKLQVPSPDTNSRPPSIASRIPDLPHSNGSGIDRGNELVKPKASSAEQSELEVFRCGACAVDCYGEASYLKHVQGKEHQAKAGKGFAGLVPNDMGVIPMFSCPFAEQILGQQISAAMEVGSTELQAQHVDVHLQKLAAAVDSTMRCSSRSRSRSRSPPFAQAIRQSREKLNIPIAINCDAQQHSKARRCLPMYQQRSHLLELVDLHQVVILEGETGCGKTTQAPQYLLEEAARLSLPCRILCTQPRRLAAIGVAKRVAEERSPADGQLGATVGFAVRGEHCASEATCLLFCTTGVVLRRLQSDPELADITHVIVDEVHERSVESDLLLLFLKHLCSKRKDLHVLLMSATIDSDLLENYFGSDVAKLKVPGRLFHVETYFLEDALKLTQHRVDLQAEWVRGGGPAWKEKAEPKDPETLEDIDDRALRGRYASYDASVHYALQKLEPDMLNIDLVTQLLASDLSASGGSSTSVLIFVSGVKEIEQVIDAILSQPEFASTDAQRWVLPLHGGLPYEEQSLVFLQPPAHVRKIVVSTNVAETSLTIDDIGLVIDTGRMKENRFDGVRMMASLDDVVVSQANARQRRGRAGRVGPGVCVHLFTRYRHDSLLHSHQLPEVRRTPLEQLVLRVHDSPLATLGANAVCAMLLEPPDPETVQSAVALLKDMGALEQNCGGGERLTGLGEHLAALPLHPRLGKLIVMGAMFGVPQVIDDTLTVAAALSSRSPWLAPRNRRHEVDAARTRFARHLTTAEGMQSDHLAIVAAYAEWDSFPHCAKLDFAKVNFLSNRTLKEMQNLKRQLLEYLSMAGLVQHGLRTRDAETIGSQDGSDGVLSLLLKHQPKGSTCIDKGCRPNVLAGLICAALCPNVVLGTDPGSNRARDQGGNTLLGPRAVLHVWDRSSGSRAQVQIHSSSVHGGEGRNAGIGSPYLVYNELVKVGDALRVRDVTPISPVALILFGSSLRAVDEEPGVLSVCGWLKFRVPEQARKHLLTIRRELDRALWQNSCRSSEGENRYRRKKNGFAALFEAVANLL